MSIKNECRTPVEIYRDGKKILNTKALVQEGKIYFADTKINELDIIKVILTKEEFEVISRPHKEIHPRTKQILYIKAEVKRS
ncbi:MAG: hypothetical protein HQ555_07260 [Candidatus Aminicenantes bacterium]|nr:hypothetical protein [Candidatus Aminicenantes bacterium]